MLFCSLIRREENKVPLEWPASAGFFLGSINIRTGHKCWRGGSMAGSARCALLVLLVALSVEYAQLLA